MEYRNIALTLEKARDWYNSGSSELKEIALQAYTEEELTTTDWENIKTFEDAKKALGLTSDDIMSVYTPSKTGNIKDHLLAIYKLDIIRKALNMGWEPSLVKGTVYYPYVRFYPAGDNAREVARNNNERAQETFVADGKKYTLVGGGCYYCNGGLGGFGYGSGDVPSYLGLLCCKSKEIAKHMGKYFAKEIFEACYAHHVGAYEWCN